MGLSHILPIIGGIVMSVYLGMTITPSVNEQIEIAQNEVKYIDNQKVIFDALQKYMINNSKSPKDINEGNENKDIDVSILIPKYLPDNENIKDFTFSIDNKGLVKIKTPITNNKNKDLLVNSNKSNFSSEIIVEDDIEYLSSNFLLPIEILKEQSNISRNISVSNEAPDIESNKYWYDTTNGSPILKFNDNGNWVAMKESDGASKSNHVYENKEALKNENLNNEDLKEGDIKYAYDSVTNAIQEYVYYNNNWVASAVTGKNATHYTDNPYLDQKAIRLGYANKNNQEIILCQDNKYWCLRSNSNQVVDWEIINRNQNEVVAMNELYDYYDDTCDNIIQDYGSYKIKNKCSIISKQPYNSSNIEANTLGIASWNGTKFYKDGSYWYYKENNQPYYPCEVTYPTNDVNNLRCSRSNTHYYGASISASWRFDALGINAGPCSPGEVGNMIPYGGTYVQCAVNYYYCSSGGYVSGTTCVLSITEHKAYNTF